MTSLEMAPRARPAGFALDSTLVLGGIYAALVALAALPVWLWPIPRGNDVVNHWARLTLYRLAPGDPLSGLYRAHFGLVPNLGLDAFALALSPLLSTHAAVQLAWSLAIALPAFGAFAIHLALHEKPSPTILLAPLLSYNIATTVGLVNFSLGMGLAFFGLA